MLNIVQLYGKCKTVFDIRKRIKKIRWGRAEKKLPGDMPQAALAMYI